MKSRFSICIAAIAVCAVLRLPAQLAAQEKQDHKGSIHHHYQLLDLGTFGGPTGWICNDPNFAGGACGVLNNRGTIISGADSSTANPNYGNPSIFLPPNGSPPGDPFIQHAYRWNAGALEDLGTLPGGFNSFAQSISTGGLVAGVSENGAFDPLFNVPAAHAVLWPRGAGSIIDLGTLDGGYESAAFSVNDRAQVVGWAFNTIPDSFWFFPTQVRAFLWQNGKMQDLGTLGTGTDAWAYWVNEQGQVAGASFTSTTVNPILTPCTTLQIQTPTQDPFLWDNGNLIDLGTLGGTCGVPNAINNRGQVVGLSDTTGDIYYHAFLWPGKNNTMQDLGTLGGCCAIANWIDDSGAIVGGSYLSDGEFHAFIWKHELMADLGPKGACTEALGINSREQVVGFTCSINALGDAVLWEDGQFIDLNVFNYPGSGLQQLVLAYNINNSGEIVGLGVPPSCADPFSCGHGYVLIPCDDHHPGVEGCDYSLADGKVAVPSVSPAVHSAAGRTIPPLAVRPGYRLHIPGAAISPRN
jgi:probable HAF family extracellular repeat protein